MDVWQALPWVVREQTSQARPVPDGAHIMRELGMAINALRAADAASPAGSADEP